MAKRKRKKQKQAQPPLPPAPKPAAGGGIARKAGAAGAATMLSRVTGLVREQVIAFLFGAGAATDAYNVAFRIPNLLRDLFAEGALNQSFTPTFTKIKEKQGKDVAFALKNRVAGALILTVGLITLLGIVFTPQFVGLFASGMLRDPAQGARTILMTRILMPFLLVIALAALAMGALNSLEYFFLPALAPVMLNMGSVILGGGLAMFAPRLGIEPIVGLAIGTMAGGLLQWVVQLPPLWKEGYRFRPRVDFADEGVRAILKLMAPAVLANGSTQINVLLNTQIASYLVTGSISWLAYAFRLMQLPIGIFGVAVGQATQVKVAKHVSRDELADAARALEQGLALVFVCTVPASVVLMVLARPIIGLVYEWRNFSAHSADQTAAALVFYAIGLVGFSAVKVIAGTYYALEKTRVPVRASVTAVVSNVAMSALLMGPLGHRGLALATSINGLVNMMMLLWPMREHLTKFEPGYVAGAFARVAAASAGMGVVCHFTAAFCMHELGAVSPMARLATVSVALAASGISLIPLLKLAGVREVDDALGMILRKFRRR